MEHWILDVPYNNDTTSRSKAYRLKKCPGCRLINLYHTSDDVRPICVIHKKILHTIKINIDKEYIQNGKHFNYIIHRHHTNRTDVYNDYLYRSQINTSPIHLSSSHTID